MGWSDEQGEGSRSVAKEFSRLLGIELEHEPAASEAWETEAQAEAKAEASWVQTEEGPSYEEEQRLTQLSLNWDYTDYGLESRGG